MDGPDLMEQGEVAGEDAGEGKLSGREMPWRKVAGQVFLELLFAGLVMYFTRSIAFAFLDGSDLSVANEKWMNGHILWHYLMVRLLLAVCVNLVPVRRFRWKLLWYGLLPVVSSGVYLVFLGLSVGA